MSAITIANHSGEIMRRQEDESYRESEEYNETTAHAEEREDDTVASLDPAVVEWRGDEPDRSEYPFLPEEERAPVEPPIPPVTQSTERQERSKVSQSEPGWEPPKARLPLIHQPKLAEIDPKLYGYWLEHINQGFQRNNRMFDTILDAFMRPYNTTIWMYRILFGLGIAAFLVAAALSAWLRDPMFGLVFGGLSIISFLTYFIGRPLQSLEENLKFITWLGIIYNSYWTRLVYMMDSETVNQDLEDATQDAINEIERLLDKHHDFSGKRPGLR
jgi:hypothetical protein